MLTSHFPLDLTLVKSALVFIVFTEFVSPHITLTLMDCVLEVLCVKELTTEMCETLNRYSRNSAFPLVWCIKWQLPGANRTGTSEPPGAL